VTNVGDVTPDVSRKESAVDGHAGLVIACDALPVNAREIKSASRPVAEMTDGYCERENNCFLISVINSPQFVSALTCELIRDWHYI